MRNKKTLGCCASTFSWSSGTPWLVELLEQRCLLTATTLDPKNNIPFSHFVLDNSTGGSDVLEKGFGDINGDGKLDAVIGFGQAKGLAWYQFPASGNPADTWIKHTIVSTGDAYEQLICADVNHDGAVDVVASLSNQIVWFQNPMGSGGNPATSPWTEHVIGNTPAHEMYLADIDGDGKLDIVTNPTIYFQNSPTSWTAVAAPNYNRTNRGTSLFDSGKGLGAVDIAGTGNGPNCSLTWWENPRDHGGNARTDPWIAHVFGSAYTTDTNNGVAFASFDVNGDGRADIITAEGEDPNNNIVGPGLVWWEAPVDRINGTWTEHVIDSTIQFTHILPVADMNGDGQPELLLFEQDQSAQKREMILYNVGGTGQNWQEQLLGSIGGHNETTGDVTNDGDVDILNAPHGFYNGIHPIEVFMSGLSTAGIVRPVVNAAPASRTVSAGTSTTFSVGATGTGPLSYQWQQNGLDIAGANSSTYTISAVPAGDNGMVFRCVVGNPSGLIPSSGAVLTVGPSTVPGGTLGTTALVTTANQNETLLVTYSGPKPIDTTSLGNANLTFSGQGLSGPVAYVGVDGNTGSNTRVATYSVAPPAGGWVYADNGDYTVSIGARQVDDTSGNYVPSGALGHFTVSVPNPSAGAGSLIGSSASAASSYNLTAVGASDWAHWGTGQQYLGFNHKATGANKISNVSTTGSGGNYGAYTDSSRTVSWTDGTPSTSNGGDHAYIWSNGALNTGFTFTAPADTSTRTLTIYAGGINTQSTLQAHLSDGSAADYTVTASGTGLYTKAFTITYAAASAGQTLTITYTKTGNLGGRTDGSADLIAAYLNQSTPPATPAAPTLTAATPGNSQVNLAWSAVQGANSYNLYRGTTPGGESATPIQTGLTATTFTDSGLSNGTTYYYKVAAVNGAGTGATSNELSATPQVAKPAAPTLVSAAPQETQVTLSWTAVSGASSYNLYRSTNPGGEGAIALQSGLTSTTFTDTGLTDATTYYYTVAAVNAAGVSAASNELSATPIAKPAAPTLVSATAQDAQVTLSWTAVSGAASYNVCRSTTPGGEGATALQSGLTSTTFTDTSLSDGTTYYYTVAAVNTSGAGPSSNELSATPQLAVPTAPTLMSATGQDTQVNLSWSAVSGAASYNIYRSTTAGGEGATPLQSGLTSTTFADTGLTDGTTYYYTVAAVNASGTSPASNELSATPQAAKPGAPTLSSASAQDSQVSLTWTAVSNAASYNLYRSTTPGGEGASPVQTGLTSTSFVDTALTDGTTYYYQVSAVSSAAGEGALSNELSATPQAAPAAPTLQAATAGSGQVALAWSAVPGAATYQLYRSTTSGGEGATPVQSAISQTSFTDTGLVNGTTYYYEVSAANSSGMSGVSNERSATPQVALPTAPTGVAATAGDAQVAITWTAVQGAASYNVYRSTSAGGEGATPLRIGLKTTTFTDTGLTNGVAYFYKVTAVNSGGQGPASAEVSATPKAAATGQLTGSSAAAASSYNLTKLGATDWAHWGTGQKYLGFNHKATGGSKISNVSTTGSGGNYGAYTESARAVSWTDGTPSTSNGGDHSYIWSNGALNTGFTFTVPADTTTRTLTIYAGGINTQSTLRAHLSDGSAADYTVTASGTGLYTRAFTITYHAASAGQMLTITYTKTGNLAGHTDGSADLIAAYLA